MIDGKDFGGKISRCLINFKMLNKYSNEDVRLAVGSMAVEFLRKRWECLLYRWCVREGHT